MPQTPKLYAYERCGTCRKAKKFLDRKGVAFKEIPIREKPPSMAELKAMLLQVGDVRRLFNTSGVDYRSGGWKEKLGRLSETQALQALSKNGNLIKRPFVWFGSKGTVGFNEDEWKKLVVTGG